MGYNSARVIIGDQSEGRFITLSEASPKHRRCFAEQLGNIGDESAMDHQTIGDIITSNMHRRCLHEHRRFVADVSPMCRRCEWDIFGLGVHRRMFADCSALFSDISPMVFGVETSAENLNACIKIFLDVPMPWRNMAITRVRRRSFAEPLVHGGAALAMPKFVHRESIGRLKKPRGTVALLKIPSETTFFNSNMLSFVSLKY